MIMTVLHNRVSGEELKKRLYEEDENRVTISFYRYFKIDNPRQFRDDLYKKLSELRVFGRIYVASEGINAQISVLADGFEIFKEYLDTIDQLNGIRLNAAVDHGKSFWVLKIKVRDKIVADGIRDAAFNMDKKGKYVTASQMNKLMDDAG